MEIFFIVYFAYEHTIREDEYVTLPGRAFCTLLYIDLSYLSLFYWELTFFFFFACECFAIYEKDLLLFTSESIKRATLQAMSL